MAIQETSFENKMRNPRTRIYLPELFLEANKASTDKARVDLVKAYNDKSPENAKLLRDYLQCLYHPAVKLELPDTVPPYDDTQYVDYDMAPQTLQKALARVTYFVLGQPNYIEKVVKRENVFIQTLEGLHKNDAELYASVLLKKFPKKTYPKLGMHIFNKAVPEYLPESVIDVEGIIATEKKPKTASKVTKTTKTKK